MATLIAIGYPDETTAFAAQQEAERRADDLVIGPDAVAAIVRDADGTFRVNTNHHSVGDGAMWGMLWGALFGLLFFVPFLGMPVGAGLGALMGRIDTGVDARFQAEVRDMLQPGTSALFLVVAHGTPARAVDALRRYGGTVLSAALSEEDERQLQLALYGQRAAA
jgi:uncharacterized membrane protein